MTTIDADRERFEAWHAGVLESLYPNREAGVAVFVLSLPLAERLMRQMNGLPPEKDLSDSCMSTLVALFPQLGSVTTARQFWAAYCHGFLHQVALSRSTRAGAALPVAWLSHDIPAAIEVRADGSFWTHPVLFSQAVVGAIRGNFAAFVGKGTPGTPLPGTVVHVGTPGNLGVLPTYIGTGGRT